ncbi:MULTISPECIES: pre-peptidase C-terminal domain-containing protein [Streptomyces]|uniref:pre-peptidase C-terminal domain-containing protein n=1 Tax=Streptomyces TaxID=1883 RepID=UPI0029B67AC8|nr:pre-peptidase C-terminal domain-containing protein [Streptomyces sp. WI03-4A]MDX2592047.1 pre-peptidase C-terminal domain-containing protein [Streptomyces sp. WI03-4A]
MTSRTLSRPLASLLVIAAAATTLAVTSDPAHASADRIRLGSASDVSRSSWSGPAFTMNGDGSVVGGSMTRAIDAIRGDSGSLDVVVLAGSAPTAGSRTPECDTITALSGVNSCTTWTLTTASDGNNTQLNTDVRDAEFVYFAGGDQCRYAAWKGTALQASVQSVVAKGGGAGGGSAGLHINSSVVYDACTASATSAAALANPYDRSVTFTTGMFNWPNYGDTINDSHFVARDRMGRTMAFVARAIKDGLTTQGKAWGVGINEGGSSLYIDRNGLATLYGSDAYVVLGDHQPEQAVAGKPLTFSNYKIWHLTGGRTFDFASRPTCGYYRRSVNNGVPDANLYNGAPETGCGTSGGGTTVSESEPNDSRSTADDIASSTPSVTLTGALSTTSDRDYFRFSLTSGATATISCAIPDAYDADAYLLDSSGSTLTRSVNDGRGSDESLTYTRTASGSGTYYLDLESYAGSGFATYACDVNTA